ncbi:MAG: alpha/beta hydrolase [Xenococcaceae cyanobacterium]
MKNLLLIRLGICAIVYILICISLRIWHNRLIFVPTAAIETKPEDLGLTYQEVWLSANDKSKPEKIHSWWIQGDRSDSPTLLYLHGNGANIGANVKRAQRFVELGFSVLLFDYRGYGRSEGNFPTEKQLYRDAEIAWNYLVEEKKIHPKNIFLYGHSLGGAIAIELALRQPNLAGLIVEGSFTSIRKMANLYPLYRIFPLDLIITQKFDSIAKVSRVRSPILFIHGSDDSIVPAKMSQALFEATKISKKMLLIIPEADHNNVALLGGDRYLQAVKDFYRLVLLHQKR